MKKISDPKRIAQCLRTTGLQDQFDTPDLPFLLFSYDKHELIASPMARLEYLLFVVSGDVHIFGLHRDGGAFPVNIASKGRRFAQNRKRTLPPCRILRVTPGERTSPSHAPAAVPPPFTQRNPVLRLAGILEKSPKSTKALRFPGALWCLEEEFYEKESCNRMRKVLKIA